MSRSQRLTRWDGSGITSTSARSGNVSNGFDLYGLGAIRNSDLSIATGLPGSHLAEFRGEPVGEHDVLARYTYIGDANLDGMFSTRDLIDVLVAGLYEDEIANNATWATGDWNGDGDFATSDFVLALQSGGFGQGPRTLARSAAVPEPSRWALFTLSFASTFLYAARSHRRNKRRPRPPGHAVGIR